MTNLKSASFVVIMLLNERLTRVHSHKDPRLHFGESFALTVYEEALQGFPCDYLRS